MEGRPHPGVLNWLWDNRSLADLAEHGPVIQSLLEHPGWAIVDEVVEALRLQGEENLDRIAHKTALSIDPEAVIAFAAKKGTQDGVTFARDVAASLIDAAKTAAAELRDAAEMAAEGV